MKPFDLPETFMLGVATASAQIEGGDTNNSWYRWSHQKGNIADGTNCGIADDHWNRIDEDIELMKQMNIDTYRLSLEWSRIEPEKEKFSRDAINHYRDEIIKLKNAGIIPLITLHHFSNPLWLEDSGGWMNNDVVRHFNFRRLIADNLQLGHMYSNWKRREKELFRGEGFDNLDCWLVELRYVLVAKRIKSPWECRDLRQHGHSPSYG